MVGVLCLLCWITPAPFSARGLIEFTHACTHRHERTSNIGYMALMFQEVKPKVSTSLSFQPDASLNLSPTPSFR